MAGAVNFMLSERKLDERSELLSLEGAATAAAAERLRHHVTDMLARRPTRVVVDLSRVTFLDASLGVTLSKVSLAAKGYGARLLIVEPVDPKIAQPLTLAGLEQTAEVFPTLLQAERAFAMKPGTLQSAIPPPAPQQPIATKPRRTLLGRRQTDQDQMREIAELRRIAHEAQGGEAGAARDAQARAAQAQAEAAQKELEGARARIQALDAEVTALKTAQQRADETGVDPRIEALRSELAGAHAEAERMDAEAEEAHKVIHRLEAEGEVARAEAKTLRRERDIARTELDDIRGRANRVNADAEAAHKRIHALEAEVEVTRAELLTVRNQLEAARSDSQAAAGAG